ncbi:MAG: metal-binding protein [Cytophagales bacterium]|nr:metal-binding protein [Armatimonadota bacterium]
MPSGKVHDRITVIAAVAAVPVWYATAPVPVDPTVGLALLAATLFSGLMLSPDLDLNSSVYSRWGPFRYLWWPYQKAIPHRSKLSHSYFLGPALRVVYFLVLAWLLLRLGTWVAAQFFAFDRNALSRQATDLVASFWHRYPDHARMTALGLFLGTALHCAADSIVSGIKKRF